MYVLHVRNDVSRHVTCACTWLEEIPSALEGHLGCLATLAVQRDDQLHASQQWLISVRYEG